MISHLHRDNSWGILIAVANDKLLHSASTVVVAAGVRPARRVTSRTVHAVMQVIVCPWCFCVLCSDSEYDKPTANRQEDMSVGIRRANSQ